MDHYIKESEIIGQKKDFIFEVEQTSNHVFPNEIYTYYIYIKNISGVDIENFKIKIKHPDSIIILDPVDHETGISIKNDEVRLYEMKAYCTKDKIGENIVNFFGYGDGTQVLSETLKIKCTRTYNSDKLIHRINIYDFSPYEENYVMETDNYSEEVTQIFKRQKLPYKAGEQPFPIETNLIYDEEEKKYIEDPHFYTENKESQSFLDQYKEAKNTKEHVYQYLSRENFVEDSIESFEGENLQELFAKINNNSAYFNARFFNSGTNQLLNDFTQYEPNGFIYRMGLLSSELYHLLGVVPSYSYMSDYLFRWAPHPSGKHLFLDDEHSYTEEPALLNLYPKQQAMEWDKHVWAGRGWIVYRVPTEEFEETDEFKEKFKTKEIELKENIGSFEEKKTAKEFVDKMLLLDEQFLAYEQSKIQKFNYVIEESLYDNGVFFVNIPINQIPSNFYILNSEVLYPIIETVKPFGTKPILNYIMDFSFYLNMKEKLVPNYYEIQNFSEGSIKLNYEITQNKLLERKATCDNVEYDIIEDVPIKKYLSSPELEFDGQMNLKVDSSNIGISFVENDGFNTKMEKSIYGLNGKIENDFRKLKNILEILYKNNYNSISFFIDSMAIYPPFRYSTEDVIEIECEDSIHYLKLGNKKERFDTLKIEQTGKFIIEDGFNKKHEFSAKLNEYNQLYYIDYETRNKSGKRFIKKQGAVENLEGISIKIFEIFGKKMILFFIQKDQRMHYFAHALIPDVLNVQILNEENPVSFKKSTKEDKIVLNTPAFYSRKDLYPTLISGGENWTNLYRLNDKDNSYAFIINKTMSPLLPDKIRLHYDNINIPETGIIKEINFKSNGQSNRSYNVYVAGAKNTNYLVNDVKGNSIQYRPNKIEAYNHLNNSTTYYQIKKELAERKNQESLIKKYEEKITENIIFNEDIDIEVNDYIKEFDDYITITHPYWCELSEFNFPNIDLNNTESILLVIEGFNHGSETNIFSQTLYDVNNSSEVSATIPSGYFYKKIPLLYPNEFILQLMRVRFRFKNIIKDVDIFNTAVEINLKNKENQIIEFENINYDKFKNDTVINISNEYLYPADYNNGLTLELDFNELNSGGQYSFNTTKLEVIYQETSIDFIANSTYQSIQTGSHESILIGKSKDVCLKGEFYDDHEVVSQIESNIGIDNQGVELQDSLYQSFIAADNNITAIEIYPNGFMGQPDEVLKIGLYTSHGLTPDDLIKEVYASGWIKTNENLKNRSSIKYNINVDNLEIGQRYWIKFEVDTPQENSYYLLKGTNKNLSQYKMLLSKNNNYINTFNCLTFNIYSKNIVKSFNHIPAVQENFDNPNILLGLNRGRGQISNLIINKNVTTIFGEDHMGERFENDITQDVCPIIHQGNKHFIYRNGQKIYCNENGEIEGETNG